MRSLILLAAAVFMAVPAFPQPFDPGPRISVPGSSVSGMRIDGAPPKPSRGIRNAPVFGDTVEERAYGRDYDNSYLNPRIPRGVHDEDTIEMRARQGDRRLDPGRAGAFARCGPGAIGASEVTRGRTKGSGHRAIIRK
ncbi:hypothetical protein [Jiella mangrovi]|uniref:Uncharacterized protein n=1 Tax=Jiella mangrovi TaxID=2821407 RepID=A0ABS4BBD0_9HYPH|nr:hypothetical protein [Jiella mangrovi]MBP0614058.1 hypothetical protein [Jiella mangrovi]